ncbi:hypothetical protein CA606_04055 [Caulobacter vibrioides]|uniref:DUF4345 domain-containing protein n=1 Tax=Caulobacter vibrioides TaxID=155892 RepID=A0A290MHN4_CAUVI|nr:hypothetical protein [Caulobacter vibrioides]ATC31594.1 hypothetical protein CA606_04055 [Caulobacter vibrioides]
MSLLPPSTNAAYRGSRLAAWALMVFGLMTLGVGVIHFALPDGGIGVIAGVDLSTRREIIVSMAAWMGALQIAHGVGLLLVGWRYRTLVPLFLALTALERGLMALDGWLLKGANAAHHPPQHYGSVLVFGLCLVLLAMSLRNTRAAN